MAVSKNILGMNARNFLYIRRYNSSASKRLADDKLETKKILTENDIPTPKLIAEFGDIKTIRKFNWHILPENGFVIKPARGYAGAGILPIRKWGQTGISATGEEFNIKQLESHLIDILEGAYSLQNLPDKAFIEERVILHPFFRKLTPVGIPDIRVIVFNSIPVMAMVRLPTRESGGKANLHLGAVGIGIDLKTGITTHAIQRDEFVVKLPDTKIKSQGIKLPEWDKVLLMAVKTQSIAGLGYSGIDIVYDKTKGPMILELNARPGLSIQNANKASLRTRLERVEDIVVQNAERGVEIAKNLFAESFSDKVQTTPKILRVIEPVLIYGKNGYTKHILAKIDTGAFRTSIHDDLAKELGLEEYDQKVYVRSASGQNFRHTVSVSFDLGGKRVKTVASSVDRSHMTYPMIVGRRDLQQFYINPQLTDTEKEHFESKENPLVKGLHSEDDE